MAAPAFRPRSLCTRTVAVTVALSILVGTAASFSSVAVAGETTDVRAWPEATTQQNVFTLTNAHRARYGAPALRYQYPLAVAAQRHANDMARRNRLTHTGSDGSNAGQRISRAGFRWTSWAENVAVGYTSSSSVVNAWLNSSGHRANLLNPRFRWMGVGLAYGAGRTWWCVVYASG